MRRNTLIILALFIAAACTQKTETQTTVDSTGTVQSSTTTTKVTPAIDTATTAEIKAEAKEAAHATGTALEKAGKATKDAARDAAHATGTALEKAGKAIQKKTKKP